MSLFFSTFTLIFLAELPDKTALATLLLASKGGRVPVFTGVALAFLVQCLIAVTVGQWLGRLPPVWIKAGTGVLFLSFAFLSFRKRNEEEESPATAEQKAAAPGPGFWIQAGRAFGVIFIAEWGDLTQLSTASLAAHTPQPWIIFSASLLALWSVTALAVVLGKKIADWVSPRQLLIGSSVLFAIMGIYFLGESLRLTV